jgi:hypothetical protein
VLEPSGLYYPNFIARRFLLAMDEVMGKNSLNAVLEIAGLGIYINQLPPDNLQRQFDFSHMAALNESLEKMYGPRGGRGLALRVGRACFAQGLNNFGALKGVSDPAFQTLPLDARVKIGLPALVQIFANFSDQHTTMHMDGDIYRIVVEASPMAWGRTADRPVCHALVGIWQEGLRWISNGYEFHVQETACRAAGNEHCIFTVNSQPIGQL